MSNENLDAMENAALSLVSLSKWVDEYNAHRNREAALWGRVAKVCEESGEAMQALIGFTGQNPRKGSHVTHSQLREELLDVAATALGAVEHLDGHTGESIELLFDKIERTWQRARVSVVVPHEA